MTPAVAFDVADSAVALAVVHVVALVVAIVVAHIVADAAVMLAVALAVALDVRIAVLLGIVLAVALAVVLAVKLGVVLAVKIVGLDATHAVALAVMAKQGPSCNWLDSILLDDFVERLVQPCLPPWQGTLMGTLPCCWKFLPGSGH